MRGREGFCTLSTVCNICNICNICVVFFCTISHTVSLCVVVRVNNRGRWYLDVKHIYASYALHMRFIYGGFLSMQIFITCRVLLGHSESF